MDCYVAGFLTPDSYYNTTYDLQSLNRFIILPSFEFDDPYPPEEEELVFIVYLDKCNGFLYSDQPSTYLQSLIDRECYALDITPFQLEMHLSLYPSVWGLEGERLGSLWLAFTAIITGMCVLCVSVNQTSKILRLKTDYAVWIANGFRKSTVCLAIVLENLWINGFTALAAALFGKMVRPDISVVPALVLSVCAALLSSVYPATVFSRLSIAKSIRGDPVWR